MVETKLEVIPITTRYACSICKEVYDFEEDAVKCLDKGIIGEGSEIKPGLVVKGTFLESFMEGYSFHIFRGMEEYTKNNENDYLMFIGEKREGHDRTDSIWGIKSKIKGGLLQRKRTYEWIWDNKNIKRDRLRRLIKNESICLLDKKEFEEVKNIIKNKLHGIRKGVFKKEFEENLFHAFNNLYNYHEYFDLAKK